MGNPPRLSPEAFTLMQNILDTQATLRDVTPTDITLAKDLITELKTLEERLSALLTDLGQQASLDQFSGDTQAAYQRLKNTVGQSPDVIVRQFTIGQNARIPAVLTFVDGLVDNTMVDQDILEVAQSFSQDQHLKDNPETCLNILQHAVLGAGHVSTETAWSTLVPKLMGGNTLVFVEGSSKVLVVDTVKFPARSISEPTNERSVNGPQEAFNEVILTSMNLIRRRIRSPNLHFDVITLGDLTRTSVAISHIEGVTNPELVAAVKKRLGAVQMDGVYLSQQLIPALSSNPWSLFPQVRSTERVDVAVRDLILGKVVILIDNTPYALTVPSTLMDFYQTTDDYTTSFWGASLERLIRFLGLFLGLLLPPLYIALTSVNPELLPAKLVLTIAGSRVGLPTPPFFEVLVMWAIIEVMREAAVRLPKQLSNTLGTVGAIVVGTAIVKAGIVSPIMIVIITLTALGLFTSPVFEMAVPWRVIFWFLIVTSYMLGLFGIILALLIILGHLASLENFGVPYLSPFGPYRSRDLKDSLLRFPQFAMKRRPAYLRAIKPTHVKTSHPDTMLHPELHQTQKARWGDHE